MTRIRVKSQAESDKLLGRAPQAAPQPPSAPAPAPVKAAPPAPAPVVDHEARNLLRANADQLRALTQLVLQQASQSAPAASPPAPPAAPEPAPQQAAPAPARLLDFAPARPPLSLPADLPRAAPAPAPEPAAVLQAGTIKATIARDKQDRIKEFTVERDGKAQTYAVQRDRKGRIDTITPINGPSK